MAARDVRLVHIGLLLSTVVIGGEALAQQRPAGGEFRINTYTSGNQGVGSTSVSMNEQTGDFIVVWVSDGQDGSSTGVFAQRYDRNAVPLGSEFQVNTYTTGDQGTDRTSIGISTREDGSFLVAWPSATPSASSDIVARLYDSAGVPDGSEFLVDTAGGDEKDNVRVDHDAAGNFVLVWESRDEDGSGLGVFGRRLDASGVPVGTRFQVNTYTTDNQFRPAVAVVPDGSFVVTWTHLDEHLAYQIPGFDVIARRFAADATPLGPERLVPDHEETREWWSDIDNDAAGDFIVVWTRSTSADRDFFARRLDSSGTPVGSEYSGGQSVAIAPSGEYAFVSVERPSFLTELFVQRFDAADQPLGPLLSVPTEVLAPVLNDPGMDMDAAGNFVAVWTRVAGNSTEPGPGLDVAARRYCDDDDPTCDVCAGFDDAIDDDADGIPNGCDPCTELSVSQEFTSLQTSVSYGVSYESIPVKQNRIRLKGDVSMPGLVSGIDPPSTGMRLLIESTGGGKVVDLAIPGGVFAGSGTRGWKTNTAGTSWQFLDRTETPVNGLRKISIVARPPGARIVLKAAGGTYAVGNSYIPLRTFMVFGNQSSADAGACALARYDAGECDAGYARPMRCRR